MSSNNIIFSYILTLNYLIELYIYNINFYLSCLVYNEIIFIRRNEMLKMLLYVLFFGSVTLYGQTIHSSAAVWYELKDFSSSLQKTDAKLYGIGLDLHKNNSAYKIVYEYGDTNTKQPPLAKDLEVQKLYFHYEYHLKKSYLFSLHHIRIRDNIALTDGGKTYGIGVGYIKETMPKLYLNYYQTNYDDFKVSQSDLEIVFQKALGSLKLKLNAMISYIDIKERTFNSFTKNAQKSYLPTALKFHLHYKSYHFGLAGYFGKRVFSVMGEGYKIQHHAMEFSEIYSLGIGKGFNNYVVRLITSYQKAEELPKEHKGVEVKAMKVVMNYKF